MVTSYIAGDCSTRSVRVLPQKKSIDADIPDLNAELGDRSSGAWRRRSFDRLYALYRWRHQAALTAPLCDAAASSFASASYSFFHSSKEG